MLNYHNILFKLFGVNLVGSRMLHMYTQTLQIAPKNVKLRVDTGVKHHVLRE